MPELWLLILLGLLIYVWHNGLAHREIATRICREACQRRGFQLLDGSVQLSGLSLARCARGHRCLRRRYRFAYSSDHFQRNSGVTILKGSHTESIVFSTAGNAVQP